MPLWLADRPLLLASRSEARRSLLAAAGIPVEVSPADLDERALERAAPSSSPEAVAIYLAEAKAAATAQKHPGRLTLGADQTLALGAQRFSKPANRAQAREQLRALSGKTHALHAAFAFVQDTAVLFEHVATARLTMRSLSDEFLESYLDAAGEAALASVGGYQLEGLGVQLFDSVEGDYFTILGLPLIEALDFLRRTGRLAQ